jgi:hypothetical protein
MNGTLKSTHYIIDDYHIFDFETHVDRAELRAALTSNVAKIKFELERSVYIVICNDKYVYIIDNTAYGTLLANVKKYSAELLNSLLQAQYADDKITLHRTRICKNATRDEVIYTFGHLFGIDPIVIGQEFGEFIQEEGEALIGRPLRGVILIPHYNKIKCLQYITDSTRT